MNDVRATEHTPLRSHSASRLLRWSILGVFAIGYALTATRLEPFASEYLFYTVISLTACALLLSRLTRFDPPRLATWVVLAVFLIAYYIKFYWILIDSSFARNMLPRTVWPALSSNAALCSGYALTTYAFLAFAVSAWVSLCPRMHKCYLTRTAYNPSSTAVYRFLSSFLLVLLPILMSSLGYLAYKFEIGLLGRNVVSPLPYRFGGIIFYSRLTLVPALSLLQVWCAERAARRWHLRIGILLLLFHGASDILLRASRGSLLTVSLELVFLAVITNLRFYRSEWLMTFCSIVVAVFLAPLITQYRWLRLSDVGIFSAVSRAIELSFGFWRTFVAGVSFVFFRIPGVEMITAIMGSGAEPLGREALSVMSSQRGIAGYLTVNIFGYPQDLAHSVAPSLVGWLYLVGGPAAVLVGCVVVGLISTVFWHALSRLPLRSGPVAQTLTLFLLYAAVAESTLERIPLQVAVTAASVGVLEVLMRIRVVRFSPVTQRAESKGETGCGD